MPSISIHIVTFNSEEHIVACLEAVYNQTYAIDQVIIVDNDSHDRTLDIIEEFGKDIKVIRNRENVGFAKAHNQALHASLCDYYLILNPDVVLDKDYILNILDFMQRNEGIGSCAGQLRLQLDPSLIDSTGLVINRSRRAFDRGAGDPIEDWMRSAEVFGVSGAAAMYSKELVEDISIGGQFFCEDFFAYKEDVDVAWRGQLLGWQSYYVAEALAYHERGWKQANRAEKTLKIRRHSYINRYVSIINNDSVLYILLHSPYIIGYEILSFGYFLLREPKVLGSWLRMYRNMPSLLRRRREIMSRRVVSFKKIYHWVPQLVLQ